ncbi:amidohydrolase family protein [Roseovarius sp. Pro17]|uniref:amidohydrolase family protein n=1 Tax=Roseovarius sp. Pro17 TaxID=3108175 RepID=UPI002D7974DD|nr:amidohydrolase family protein [Roseovarius sp. Pro17]
MTSRRFMLGGLGGVMLSSNLGGCYAAEPGLRPDLTDGAIDIHTHFFNGRDVPAIGFLQQTFLRDPHANADPDMISTAFLKLLKTILLIGTPTAKHELAIVRGGAPIAPPDIIERRDQENVAIALSEYAAGAVPDPAGLRVTPSDESRILDRIAQEVDQVSLRTGLLTPRQQARTLADEIYAKGAPGALTRGTQQEYRHVSPFLQSIRWAGLLTRGRRDILAEMQRLYGGKTGVRVFSPSIVDFTYWFKTTENDVESVADQIEVVSAIVKGYQNALVLPFAPFCPLRAALEREAHPDWDSLRNVKQAIRNLGFAGVKIYPPMGFKPIGNDADVSKWARRAPKGGGPALDRELERLYAWCVQNGVPIKAHATNSMGAGADTGRFAAPEEWRNVLSRPEFKELRVNLAHFGRFMETAPDAGKPAEQDWEETIAGMIEDFPGLYFDLGYWPVATEPNSADRARVMTRMREMIARVPLVAERMMYGSDWSMTGRVPGHQAYSARVLESLGELGFSGDRLQAVMGGNAARYLGLTGTAVQHARLATFFAGHPIFEELFSS